MARVFVGLMASRIDTLCPECREEHTWSDSSYMEQRQKSYPREEETAIKGEMLNGQIHGLIGNRS